MRLELADDLLEKKGTGRSCGSTGDESADESDDRPALPAHAGVPGVSRAPGEGDGLCGGGPRRGPR